MYAFLGFFYVFVSVYFYKMSTTKTTPVELYVDTEYLESDSKYNDEDYVMDDGEMIDEDDFFDDRYNVNVYNDNESTNDTLLVNMTVKKEDEKVIYDIYDHLKDNLITESDYSVDSSDKSTTTWTFEYYDMLHEEDIKRELIEYVDENVLTDNIILYFNGERIDNNCVSNEKNKQE